MRVVVIVAGLILAASACEPGRTSPAASASAQSAPAQSAPAQSASAQSAPAQPVSVVAAPKVAKIAFIDKEQACDCTRKRIESTWTALQAALGTPAKLPVERIHLDTQALQADAYTVLKPLMVPPGVYFLDGRDAVVELLQGEVTAEQITAVLKR